MIASTPRGFKDVLPQEALWREHITKSAQAVMASWGYAPIETPSLELLDALEQGGQLAQTPFRLFDSDGALLVLRPDVTLPIARMVASRLNPISEPLRFRYSQPVFREQESLRGQAREHTQLGVEFIGASDTAADAEVVLLLVEVLKACGLEQFKVAICTVGVLRDLLSAIVDEGDGAIGEDWRGQVLAACHQNNIVEVERLARDGRVDSRFGQALQALLGIHGGGEAISRCKQLVQPLGCVDGLDQLAQSYSIIEAVGAAEFVSVDFSVMSAFDYYTGLVFEAYAPQLGVCLGSGGRYDQMLQSYGMKAAAAGFAINLEHVMMALSEQGVSADDEVLQPRLMEVPLDADALAPAFVEAARLRAQGQAVVLARSTVGGEG
jgi:ATP phosphoribosyltransferase regulatory subunit